MFWCVGALQVDVAEHEMGEIDGQATNVTYDEDGYEPGILDLIDCETMDGDSSQGVGGSSFLDEQQEKDRDDKRPEKIGTEEAGEQMVCRAVQAAVDSSAAAYGMCEWSVVCVCMGACVRESERVCVCTCAPHTLIQQIDLQMQVALCQNSSNRRRAPPMNVVSYARSQSTMAP